VNVACCFQAVRAQGRTWTGSFPRLRLLRGNEVKGPVRSEDERSTSEAKAREIAGDSNVASKLTVAPPKR
jgi:hypothetical protein